MEAICCKEEILNPSLIRVATETEESNSKTFQDFFGDFPGLFKFVFLQDLKLNFQYYSSMYLLFCICD